MSEPPAMKDEDEERAGRDWAEDMAATMMDEPWKAELLSRTARRWRDE